MNVRHATPADRSAFLAFWWDYLIEMRGKGSEILPTERTLGFYVDLFDAYLAGDRAGVVAICPGVGVSMAGDCTPAYDSTQGRSAVGWGTFVSRECRARGHGIALREFVTMALGQLGFRTLLGSVLLDDADALASVVKIPGAAITHSVYSRGLG